MCLCINQIPCEKILYDIEPIKKVEGPVKSGPTTTNNNISNLTENVNTKFSDKDLTGKELSKGQQTVKKVTVALIK